MVFQSCSRLESLSFGDKLRTIPASCCENCVNLKDIHFPKSLVRIERMAFLFCESLTELTLPDKLEEVKGSAFAECARLEKVVFPTNLKVIYQGAFGGCVNLTSIVFNNVIPPYMASDFEEGYYPTKTDYSLFDDFWQEDPKVTYDLNHTCTVYVPEGSELNYENSTGWNKIDNVASAIKTVQQNKDASTVVAIYDLQGKKTDRLQKGVNVVHYTNGKTKKISL